MAAEAIQGITLVSIMLIVLLAAGGLATGGAVLAWVGLRRRVGGDHPFCVACGFDLFGLPPGGARCPECGAALAGRRAVRVGQRRRRGVPLVAGTTLLLLGVGGAALVASPAVRRISWDPYKPAAWLAREADRTPDVSRQAAAKAELVRRLNGREVSAVAAADVAKRALRRQADQNVTWDPWWGDFVERARVAGLISDELWARYVGGALGGYALRVTSPTTRSAGLEIWVDTLASRAGSNSRVRTGSRDEFTISGIDVRRHGVYWLNSPGSFGGTDMGLTEDLNDPVYASLTPGPQTLSLRMTTDYYGIEIDRIEGLQPLGQRTFDVSVQWELLAEQTPQVAPPRPPSRL